MTAGATDGVRAWFAALSVYAQPRLIAIFVLGFSSGLPLALTGATLSVWLADAGVTKTAIGAFALVGIAYSLKFLWAPIIDRLPIPGLTTRLGRRRGWMLATHLACIAAILGLGMSDPGIDPLRTAAMAVLVAFASASQDIVIDAWRVEVLEERQLGAGAAMVVFGFRVGMLASGAGALYLASAFGWFWAYAVMAALLGIGVITILLAPEPEAAEAEEEAQQEGRRLTGWTRRAGLPPWVRKAGQWFASAVVAPFSEFMRRPGWLAILAFIVLYKLGDAVIGVMSNPFFVEIGFSMVEIANVTKLFGFGAVMLGIFLGGLMVAKIGIVRSLLIAGVLQLLSNLVFVLQAKVGHDVAMLTVTIGFENLAGGMGTAAFVAYLSSLCNVAYTATQYALLSSLMAVARTVLSAPSGWIADNVEWITFFVISAGLAVPGLVLLIWMTRRFPPASQRPHAAREDPATA